MNGKATILAVAERSFVIRASSFLRHSPFVIRHLLVACLVLHTASLRGDEFLWSTAYAIPKETTSEGSGYFSIIEGKDGKIYIGAAKYRHNAYLVEFDPATKGMKVVVDCHKEIAATFPGVTPGAGFAAQAKIHTRNNVGESGKIYFGTKQGYPAKNEKRSDYPGGYTMVYDPSTGKTRVYDIPVKHQGIISVTPDESRNIAYISTCSDGRPIESAHFMILDLETGKYRDLIDSEHVYAFIVIDHLGRAYHPLRGGDIARYNPHTGKLERLKQTIDGKPVEVPPLGGTEPAKAGTPTAESFLVHEHSHPINWEVSPDRKTLYAVAMSGNALFAYDLTAEGDTLPGRIVSKLIPNAKATDCRAMCVAPDGAVWCGVATTFEKREQLLHVVSYKPGDKTCTDHGPIAVKNPDFTTFTDATGKELPFHHGFFKWSDGKLLPRYTIMGICGAKDGKVYVTTIYPLTLHQIEAK